MDPIICSAQAYCDEAVSSSPDQLRMFNDNACHPVLDHETKYPLGPLEEELPARLWST
jgi:hypothetical protein